jgi:hypothetical protein
MCSRMLVNQRQKKKDLPTFLNLYSILQQEKFLFTLLLWCVQVPLAYVAGNVECQHYFVKKINPRIWRNNQNSKIIWLYQEN